MGLATDAINQLGLPADQVKPMMDVMPVAYAVTYIFGTMGSAIVIAIIGPILLGINLVEACKDYEEKHGGKKDTLGPALRGINTSCALSAFARAAPPSARPPSRRKPCCRSIACLFSASAGAAKSLRRTSGHRHPGGRHCRDRRPA